MANVYGVGSPIVYLSGGSTITLPATVQGGREEDFIPEGKVWPDFQGTKSDRIKYRLRAKYTWPKLTSTEMDDMLDIINWPAQKAIKFPAFDRHYEFRVIRGGRTNAGGSELYDAFVFEIEGRHLVSRVPNLDSLNFLFMRHRFVIIN